MSLTIQTNTLRAALSSLSKVSTISTLPVLACVHLTAKIFQGITLEATNLEMGLRIQLPGADDDLNVAVSAKTLADVIAAAGEETLSLSIEGGKLLITGRGIKSRLAIQEADDYPPMPACGQTAMTLAANRLKLALKKVVLAASNDPCRPALTNVQMAQEHGHQVTLVAADGFRLAAQEIDGSFELPGDKKSLCIPAAVIRKLIPMLPDNDEQSVTIAVNEQVSQICFSWPGFEVYSSLGEANFPDWRPIVPKSCAHVIDLPADFTGAVRRAEVFGKLSAHVVALEPCENGLVVIGADEQTGESRTVFNGTRLPFRIGFNAIFAMQGLEAIGSNVHLHLGSAANAPAMLTNGSREYLYVLMPMLIGEAASVKQAAEAANAVATAESQA